MSENILSSPSGRILASRSKGFDVDFDMGLDADNELQITNGRGLSSKMNAIQSSMSLKEVSRSAMSQTKMSKRMVSIMDEPQSGIELITSDAKIVGPAWKSKTILPVYTRSDSSVYPSYTGLILPYRVVCRQRYQQSTSGHQEQFIKEMCLHERLQPYALGGVRLRREFCDPILEKVGSRDIIKLTVEEERRLEHILGTDPKEL